MSDGTKKSKKSGEGVAGAAEQYREGRTDGPVKCTW